MVAGGLFVFFFFSLGFLCGTLLGREVLRPSAPPALPAVPRPAMWGCGMRTCRGGVNQWQLSTPGAGVDI